jgi:hypothetical protein
LNSILNQINARYFTEYGSDFLSLPILFKIIATQTINTSMKKGLFILLIFALPLISKAQYSWDRHWDIKAHEKGQLHFQLGVAVPTPHWNKDSSTLEMKTMRIDNKSFEKYKGEKRYDLFGAGPFYARFEYAFNRKLSVNAGITYTNYKCRFYRDSIDVNIGKPIAWEYGILVNNISYMARLNYHLFVDTRWDVYIGGGLGYDMYMYKSYTKYPPQSLLFNGYFKAPPPVTFEGSAGFRYFFLNRTAFYMDFGYGKTYLNAGFIVKMSQPKINRSY